MFPHAIDVVGKGKGFGIMNTNIVSLQCKHQFVLEAPNNGIVRGMCKVCGEVTERDAVAMNVKGKRYYDYMVAKSKEGGRNVQVVRRNERTQNYDNLLKEVIGGLYYE